MMHEVLVSHKGEELYPVQRVTAGRWREDLDARSRGGGAFAEDAVSMTKLEKRQMLLLGKYRKQGILQFVLRWGTFASAAFAIVDFLSEETFPKLPSYPGLLACLIFGPIFAWGMWYFVIWYFGSIKKRLILSGEIPE